MYNLIIYYVVDNILFKFFIQLVNISLIQLVGCNAFIINYLSIYLSNITTIIIILSSSLCKTMPSSSNIVIILLSILLEGPEGVKWELGLAGFCPG